jgi:BlaI family transcriptional regulator, penicillinase repressor
MARPRAKELTDRELEIMQIFWKHGELTAVDAKQLLVDAKINLAYTTIATLIRILVGKGFLARIGSTARPFRFHAIQDQEEVSARMLVDIVNRVFHGSREQLLLQLAKQKRLTNKERAALKTILHLASPRTLARSH